ncbi:hypothetical protein [Pyruvatibacter mobilis]|uniref:hypothetical protein n=1 Tax=Pyruvatibacter mobilis TaxID=1712261 RepID=UPI003D0B9C16
MLIEASEVAAAIEKSLHNSCTDHCEALVIYAEIDAAECAVAMVREHVRQFSASGLGKNGKNEGQQH